MILDTLKYLLPNKEALSLTLDSVINIVNNSGSFPYFHLKTVKFFLSQSFAHNSISLIDRISPDADRILSLFFKTYLLFLLGRQILERRRERKIFGSLVHPSS